MKNGIKKLIFIIIVSIGIGANDNDNFSLSTDIEPLNLKTYSGLYVGRGNDGTLLAFSILIIDSISLNYKSELYKAGVGTYIDSGIAFHKSNIDSTSYQEIDEKTGELFDVDLFEEINHKNGCKTVIKIGSVNHPAGSEHSDLFKKVRLIKNCNGKLTDITTETFDLLWKKN